jgi:hypothetical protein
MTIEQHGFLSSEDCADLVRSLDEHRDLATDRRPDRPNKFVTYGRAAYLDVCMDTSDPERDYYAQLPETNRGLQGAFAPLYESLASKVAELVGGPVQYAPDALALPGFHVFRSDAIRSAAEGGAHFDVQYELLRFPVPADRGSPVISITVPIVMPAKGTGLQVYDVTHEDYVRAYRLGRIESLPELQARKTSAYYPYELGSLVLHRGLILHSLVSPGPIEEDDTRITLQCHGLRCGGTWIVYW